MRWDWFKISRHFAGPASSAKENRLAKIGLCIAALALALATTIPGQAADACKPLPGKPCPAAKPAPAPRSEPGVVRRAIAPEAKASAIAKPTPRPASPQTAQRSSPEIKASRSQAERRVGRRQLLSDRNKIAGASRRGRSTQEAWEAYDGAIWAPPREFTCAEDCQYREWFRRYSEWYERYGQTYGNQMADRDPPPVLPPRGNPPRQIPPERRAAWPDERARLDPWHGYDSREGLETGY